MRNIKLFIGLAGLLFLLNQERSLAQKPIEVGGLAPEIELSTPGGKMVSLSSLRGNLVLIDFWASWCAPCVQEQPELKKLYAKYHRPSQTGVNLDIYAVSLDSKKDAWERAIKKLDLPWTQVSDLKFWTSPVAKTYQLEGIPFNLLVDQKGYIIALNLHGEQLDQFLSKRVGK
ncbi:MULTISPECIES: TlpA family protein disulfide reductase [Dyadobacter]|uniref:TlpA family protein disulfide reductase n=1 Tax=Dyadobacter psychrotolerans TaxID=2541721 RepID=A0A4R5DH16_9BACT|nr:TlpA disulfide reductase family protein [Dyadobacter psychrotolerans]TDE13306.1 TlpA family protein disulfide reductase [Dyadobacter psychrotolerans]